MQERAFRRAASITESFQFKHFRGLQASTFMLLFKELSTVQQHFGKKKSFKIHYNDAHNEGHEKTFCPKCLTSTGQ